MFTAKRAIERPHFPTTRYNLCCACAINELKSDWHLKPRHFVVVEDIFLWGGGVGGCSFKDLKEDNAVRKNNASR